MSELRWRGFCPSVRQTEQLVREVAAGSMLQTAARPVTPDPDIERLEADLRDSLGTKVSLIAGRRGGRITITWYDEESGPGDHVVQAAHIGGNYRGSRCHRLLDHQWLAFPLARKDEHLCCP